MKRAVALLAGIALCASLSWAAEERSKELDRVQAAQKVLQEIMNAGDKGIPEEIAGDAKCIAVIPSMVKGGFVFGARYGKGVATCRTTGDHWSAPAPVRIEGGSWGLQIGGEAIDLVMVVMNQQGMQHLLSSKFKIGADASAAAGPVGRHVEAGTDWKMRAEVLTYSRARGIFAGITLNGAEVKQDTDDTLALYNGKDPGFENILNGRIHPPEGTRPFLSEVAKYFRVSEGVKNASNAGETGNGGTAGATTSASSRRKSSETGSSGNVGSNQGASSGSSGMTTEKMSPAQTQTNIQHSLQNTDGLSANDVSVNVTDQAVQLTGSVPSEKDKATVERIARENSGGRDIDDSQLNVK
jgi:lipid-binding SYLF domain-containing protein